MGTGGYVVLVDGPDQALAVANVVAPEHLELLVEGAEALLPLVRSAGAVFLGPYAPASVGDYLAGPNHVLPTARTARFASALRVDDFRTHIHAVSMDAATLARLAPARGRHRRGRGAPRPRPVRRSCGASRDGRARPAAPRPARRCRATTRRRSTSRCGSTPTSRRCPRRRSGSTSCATSWVASTSTAIPTVTPPSCAAALAEFHGVDPARCSAPTGPTRCCSACCSPTAAPGATVALFEPTYALHRHIASLTATAVVRAWRGPDHRRRPRRGGPASSTSRSPVITFLCSPNNPTGRAEPPEVVAHVLERAPGLVVVDEAYGQFAPWSALELVHSGAAGRPTGWSWSAPSPRRGRWRRAGSATWWPTPTWSAACEAVVLPYHLDAMTQAAGRLALRHVDAMEARVALITEERGRIAAALGELPVETWPSDANFILFRPAARAAAEVWHDLLDASVLVRDCSSWPGLDNCLRVTVGTPEENDRFLAALRSSLEERRA